MVYVRTQLGVLFLCSKYPRLRYAEGLYPIEQPACLCLFVCFNFLPSSSSISLSPFSFSSTCSSSSSTCYNQKALVFLLLDGPACKQPIIFFNQFYFWRMILEISCEKIIKKRNKWRFWVRHSQMFWIVS